MAKLKTVMVAAVTFLMSLSAHALDVEVFVAEPTDFAHLPGISIAVHDLSEPERVKAAFLPELPADIDRARVVMERFLSSSRAEAFSEALKASYQGQVKLMQYQIKKVPAITFERGRYVVYGTVDIAKAVQLYSTAIGTQTSTEAHQ